MTTTLVYLDDTYLFESTAKVTGKGRGEKGGFIELDQTIFYPQGGGQPCDTGLIKGEHSSASVTFVGFSNGTVQHYLPDSYFDEFKEGDVVSLSIGEDRRIKNAKLHSSGHLISHILEEMYPGLIPIKGYHFEGGAHVEFIDEDNLDTTGIIDNLNAIIQEDVESDKTIRSTLSNFEEVNEIRPNLAPFIPKDKPTRVVQIGTYRALPCGGTHVNSLSELTGLKITKLKRKKGNLKVSYMI